jgi:hypothetical protein
LQLIKAHHDFCGALLLTKIHVTGVEHVGFEGWQDSCNGSLRTKIHGDMVSVHRTVAAHSAVQWQGEVHVWLWQTGRRQKRPPDDCGRV